MTINNVKNNVYIGDYDAAKDREILNNKEINTIITLTTEPIADYSDMNKRMYRTYALLDSGKNPQEQVDAAVYHVTGEIESGDKFLVHCGAGMNRSPAILAAALALAENKKYQETLSEIKDAHPPTQISTNIADQAQKSVEKFRNGSDNQ